MKWQTREDIRKAKTITKNICKKLKIDLFYFLKKPCYNRIIKENGTEPAVRPQGSSRNEKIGGYELWHGKFYCPRKS